MRRLKMRAKGWGRIRITVLVLAAALTVFAGVHQVAGEEREQLRVRAAQQLDAAVAEAAPAQSGISPSAAPSGGAAGSPSSGSRTTATGTPRSVAPSSASAQPVALPPRQFSWPAAGLSVNVVPMQWSVTEPVDPPLDANGFDPEGHWLAGTGESAAVRPIVIAGHTCHQQVALCTDATFPFNRVSFSGWAVGQPATLTDANGGVVNCALADRKVVDKSKAFSFANDPCDVVVFSCNYDNPDGQIVLLTFHCGQCT